ncbi:MAG TPA: alpha/beta fold hydrolase [Candidatus Angelobacter sp.]|nr:alpha/beta fold hydrolase [Candidatus Angelobacter sp.]
MSNIIIQGIDSLPGSYFAARYLQACGGRIFYFAEKHGVTEETIAGSVMYAASRIDESGEIVLTQPQVESRLSRLEEDVDAAAADVAAVWYFTSSLSTEDRDATVEHLLSVCTRLGVEQFNFVEFDFIGINEGSNTKRPAAGGLEPPARISAHEIAQCCKERQIACRVFQTSLVVGSGHPALEHSGTFSQFVSALHSLKSEIEERSPQYFDFRTLRFYAPADSSVNLVPVTRVADLLLSLSGKDTASDPTFSITSPANTDISDLCERLGVAYGLGLLCVEDSSSLNAIDRAFHDRLAGIEQCFFDKDAELPNQALTADALLEGAAFDEDEQIELFTLLRRDQDEALAACRAHAAELLSRLRCKTVTANGSELSYYVGGSTGEPVVVLNALGQGLEYWHRLLDNLIEDHRVIIWEPRGTSSPNPPFGLAEQVNDLDAVLENEHIEGAHLIGWCTGPKVAVDFYLRRPAAVRSMVFLNGTFKCDGSPEELNSAYEQNVESLLRMLVKKPAMATTVKKTFAAPAETDEIELLQGADGEEASISVLSLMNTHLKASVLAPFKTEQTTLNYAHQLIDFWSRDVRPQASEVKVPVLLIAAEYDQVATAAGSSVACDLFHNAHYLHVRGATHYCLYDRPEFIASVLKPFFANPYGFSISQSAQSTDWTHAVGTAAVAASV